MLNKRYRFHSRGGVRHVYSHGKTVRRVKASLVFEQNERGYTRVAVVVSKKVNKSAVGRNRIRRRVYEVLRRNFKYLPKRMDYIFVIYTPEFKTMKVSEIESILGELVEEAKVCYNKK